MSARPVCLSGWVRIGQAVYVQDLRDIAAYGDMYRIQYHALRQELRVIAS